MILNPLRHLGGKLNHLHLPQSRFLRIAQLANSIRGQWQSSKEFEESTVEQLRSLKSNTESLDARTYHKFEFDLMVHSQAAVFDNPSTIFDDLSPYQRKISHTVYSYTSRLNTRQLLYLNLTMKGKINNQFPNWSTLHLTPQSPSKVQLEVIPNLSGVARVNELRALKKKGVMKEAVHAKGK